MAIKFLNDIDLNRNELQFAAIHNNNGNPSGTAVVGQMSYNTADNKLYVYNGTWTALSSSVDTNTTYTMATGPAGVTTIRLTGSDATTNDVTLTGAGTTTITRTSGTELTISSADQYNGTVTSITLAAGTGSGTAISSSGIFTFTGGTGITTSVSGTTVTIAATNTSAGTVTSVAALTLGTSGTDLSSTVATSTTTPVITLNVPTASASNRGALSSADWSTFNGKENVLTFSSPLVRTTNTISIPVATTSVNGYLSSTDWNTFNGKQATGVSVLKSGSTMSGLLVLSADPSVALGAATKQYVDNVAQGLDVKGSVVVATTANISLSGAQTIDGVGVVNGDRVLVKNQTTASQNGIYRVASGGAWNRAVDMDTWAEVPGAFTFIERGTAYTDTGWVCTSNAGGTIGTTAITFTQFSGAGAGVTQGTGITITAGVISTNAAQTHVTSLGTLSGLTVTAPISGSVTGSSGSTTGNAATATTLLNSRTIAINGDITGTATSFNGGADITISSAITAGAIVNNDISSSAGIVDTKLATISTAGKVLNSATTATNANTASAIVARDASGNFSAGTITAALSGNASTATSIAGGSAGTIPYQTGAGATSFTALGTAGAVASGLTTTPESVLTTNGTAAPSWKKRTYAVTLTGSAASETITHGLATKDVVVQLYDLTTGETVMADIVRVNTSPYNTVTITFSAAPGANTVRALVTKI